MNCEVLLCRLITVVNFGRVSDKRGTLFSIGDFISL